LRQFRSFSTELTKIALLSDPLDPDVRALRAAREGKEYLQGGRLPSNTEVETNFVPKLASLTEKDKKTIKKDLVAGGKGALAAGGLLGTLGAMGGKPVSPTLAKIVIPAGAALNILDKHRSPPKKDTPQAAPPKTKQANFSPAAQLSRVSRTGKPYANIHKGTSPSVPQGLKLPSATSKETM
jgi:hypothetical protein